MSSPRFRGLRIDRFIHALVGNAQREVYPVRNGCAEIEPNVVATALRDMNLPGDPVVEIAPVCDPIAINARRMSANALSKQTTQSSEL